MSGVADTGHGPLSCSVRTRCLAPLLHDQSLPTMPHEVAHALVRPADLSRRAFDYPEKLPDSARTRRQPKERQRAQRQNCA